MARFKLKETTLTIRDMEVRVRELTQSERNAFTEAATKDKFLLPATLASLGVTEPKMTVEEWSEEPSAVVEEIVNAVMKLSGMKVVLKEGEVPPEKESDARRIN